MNHTQISSLIASKGLSLTPARVAILEICIKAEIPVDVAYVASKLKSDIHLATIYRTLEKFVSLGLLELVDFKEGKFRYEYMHSHHHHAICGKCGKIEDVLDHGIDKIESIITTQTGFVVTKHTLELFGICKTCNKKGAYV